MVVSILSCNILHSEPETPQLYLYSPAMLASQLSLSRNLV